MAKYLVETYYTCTFKVKHYLEELDENQLSKLDQRDDGKYEIIDVKLDNRKTKNLEAGDNKKENVDLTAKISSSKIFKSKKSFKIILVRISRCF